MVEYETKVAVAEQTPPAPAADTPKIYPSRGLFKYRDAQGKLWKFNTGSGVFASPAVYVIDGQEYITVASGGGSRGRRGGDLILTFALPDRK